MFSLFSNCEVFVAEGSGGIVKEKYNVLGVDKRKRAFHNSDN